MLLNLKEKSINVDPHLFIKKIRAIDSDIKIATSIEEIEKIKLFRKKYYRVIYPETFKQEYDPYYDNSFHFYCSDENGKILATATFAYGQDNQLPNQAFFSSPNSNYQTSDLCCVEVGRFLISRHEQHEEIKINFYRFFYLFAREFGIDVIVALFKVKDLDFITSTVGGRIIQKDTGKNFGSKNNYASIAWEIGKTDEKFYQWVKLVHNTSEQNQRKKSIYKQKDWDQYARAFSSVQTSFQRELQQSVLTHLTGMVADFGCGSAKLAPYLISNASVTGYRGIDYSKEMIKIAEWLLKQFPHDNFEVANSKIEEYIFNEKFDSAFSLNSYQSWADPVKILKHIYGLLKPEAIFILASPNDSFDVIKLANETDKELFMHPDYLLFKEINIELARNSQANLITLNSLIQQVQSVGFSVEHCHKNYYLGGLNYIVMKKII